MVRRFLSSIFRLLALEFIPPWLRVPCFVALGLLLGLGLAVGRVSRVTSYLSDSPEACVNCHVMRPQYASWQRSSHASAATCNDCHVPHDTLFHAYAFKARDGLYHSAVFTLGMEPQVIRMSSAAVPVVEENCRRCHNQTVEEVCGRPYEPGDKLCWDCHRGVPHGRVRSLSTTPSVMSPELPSVFQPQVPEIGGREPRNEGETTP